MQRVYQQAEYTCLSGRCGLRSRAHLDAGERGAYVCPFCRGPTAVDPRDRHYSPI